MSILNRTTLGGLIADRQKLRPSRRKPRKCRICNTPIEGRGFYCTSLACAAERERRVNRKAYEKKLAKAGRRILEPKRARSSKLLAPIRIDDRLIIFSGRHRQSFLAEKGDWRVCRVTGDIFAILLRTSERAFHEHRWASVTRLKLNRPLEIWDGPRKVWTGPIPSAHYDIEQVIERSLVVGVRIRAKGKVHGS